LGVVDIKALWSFGSLPFGKVRLLDKDYLGFLRPSLELSHEIGMSTLTFVQVDLKKVNLTRAWAWHHWLLSLVLTFSVMF